MAESEPGGEVARSELRASHEDRDRVVELLRVSAGDGRLTAEELDERLEQAMTARTYGELARLVADLPAAGTAVSPATAPQVKDVVRIDTRSGHVKLLTRPGIEVDADDVAIRSGHVRVKAPWGSEGPADLHIVVTGRVGSGHFVARPRYRNFWQWLTRQPKPYMAAPR